MKRKTFETDTKRLNFFLLYRIFHLWFTLAKFYGVAEFFCGFSLVGIGIIYGNEEILSGGCLQMMSRI